MCLNPVNEEFDRAYANVGLLASDVWSYQNEEVDYKKANLYLWIRFNETEKRLIEDDSSDDLSNTSETISIYTVQDVIPFSRLATYNNFEYNEGREKIYVVDDESQCSQDSYHLGNNDLEVWMLPEVEKEYKRYLKGSQSGWWMLSPRYPSGRDLVSLERVTNTSPQKWLSENQWPNRLLSHYAEKLYCLKLSTDISFFRDDLDPHVYDPEEVEMKLLEYPCPRYLVETNIDHRLHEIINSPTIRNLWAAPSYPYGSYSQTFGLNADVPEFQPVTFSSKLKEEREIFDLMSAQNTNNLHQIVHGYTAHETNFGTRQQHYISIFDMNYEAEVFPYSTMATGTKYVLDPEIMNMEANEELQSNQVLVSPSGLYLNLELLKSNWRNQQGGVSTNIITLEDIDMNEIVEQQLEPMANINGWQYINKNQNPEKMIAFLEKWVTKIYSPRSIDFTQMTSSSCKINKIFQNVQQGYLLTQEPIPVLQPAAQRPLYSDVLMSEASPAATNSESKFDELEQEALEQYSGSDTLIPLQVSENTITGGKWTPRQPEDMKPNSPSSSLPASEREHETKPEKLFTHLCSQEANSSEQNIILENTEEKIESKIEYYLPNIQTKWMKKKKKKTEKKKKNSKHYRRKQPAEINNKHIEYELLLVNKFLNLSNSFNHDFNLDEWKLVADQMTEEVKNIFEKSLQMFEDCSEWFMFLTLESNRHTDFSNTKERIELIRKTVNLLENLLINLQKYVFLYNKISITIPCDHRLYFSPEKLIRQRPITSPQLSNFHSLFLRENNICNNKVGLLTTVPNEKYFLKLLNSVIQEERLNLNYKREWKLPQVFETPVNKRCYEIQINFKEWRIYLAESEMEKEEPVLNVNRKSVKIVEDYPTWHSWQWKFIDGWKLDMTDPSFSFHWCNRFDIKILDEIATSARLFVMYDWILDLIDAVVLNKSFSSCEVLWNRQIPNLVSSKMVFYKLLLHKEKHWYFGGIKINQQACCHLYSDTGYPTCCVTWMGSNDLRNTDVDESVTIVKEHQSRGSQIPVQSTTIRTRKGENKSVKNRSKSKSNKIFSPKNKRIFNKIQGVDSKMNLPQEKSICVIQ